MVKSKNIIAGLGVAAGLGMALLPLGAFATDGQLGGVTTDPTAARTIRGVVGDVISIAITGDTNVTTQDSTGTTAEAISLVNLTPGKANTSLVHTVTVTTNAQGGFDFKIAPKTEADRDLRYVTEWMTADDGIQTTGAVKKSKTLSESIKIANMTTATGTMADITSDSAAGYWGYQAVEGASTEFGTTFKQIPSTSGDTLTKAMPSGTGAQYDTVYKVNYGIVPAKKQLSGAYEATIVYSATTKAL